MRIRSWCWKTASSSSGVRMRNCWLTPGGISTCIHDRQGWKRIGSSTRVKKTKRSNRPRQSGLANPRRTSLEIFSVSAGLGGRNTLSGDVAFQRDEFEQVGSCQHAEKFSILDDGGIVAVLEGEGTQRV